MKTRVFATTRFEGFHLWKDAPEEVNFLRLRHRHVFHVRAEREVSHDDRDVEFILFKREVERVIRQAQQSPAVETWSCERWATYLLERLGLIKCEVSEDGENGAVVEI